MKCKSCGSDLIAGTKKCPYCGAVINIVRTRAEDVFDWSTLSTKEKKKKDVSIDWGEGKIFDKSSGQVYNQKNHTWSEPEAVKDLFKFDRKNEEYQQVLDRQVDSITETGAAPAPVHADSGNSKKREFNLPSSMDMLKFDSFIKDADIKLVSESGEDVVESPSPAQQNLSFEADDNKSQNKNQNAEEIHEKDTYTPEEEDRVFNGLKKLMAAEEKFKADMERASYLTPEESLQAAKVEEKCSKLTFVPTVSFRSIEDEYAEYCDEHGIKHEKLKSEAPEKPEISKEHPVDRESITNDLPEAKQKKHSLRDSIRESLKNIEKNHEKAVEIKINEPSGTKVTVKTQEVSLAAAERELENAQTREVNMDEVVNPAKNLQVSVEVNAAQGNASVEVTRRHDGATVVKTVDKAQNERLYTDASKDKADTISDVDSAEDGQAVPEDSSSFWERSDSATKMTITDIFGPEARRILNQIDKNYRAEEKKADDDLENSLILDINPEDIVMTKDQTAALYNISTETEADFDETSDELYEAAADEAEVLSQESESEDEHTDVEETVESDELDADNTEITAVIDENSISEENTGAVSDDNQDESAEENENKTEIKQEKPEKYVESVEIQTEQPETESISAEIEAENKKSAENGAVNLWTVDRMDGKAGSLPQQEESSIEDVPELKKTRPIIKAEKAIMKEAERQKKRAEKAQKKLLKENKVNKSAKTTSEKPENKGFGKVLKLFTTILVIILIAEFLIIGIKLFASNSQAAVFIDKVEQYAVDLIKGGSKNSGIADSDQQSQQGSSVTETSQNQDEQQPADGSGTDAPADGTE